MRTLVFLASALLLATSSVAGDVEPTMDPTDMNVGPYAGVLQDQASHHYQNAPTGATCIAIVQDYRVSLVHLPPDATVRLSVGTYTTTSSAGTASLFFQKGVCTAFTIELELLDGDAAAYAVEVTSGVAAGGTCCLLGPALA